MAGRVVSESECYLGGTYFPLLRRVGRTLSPRLAPKMVVGDTSRDSQLHASVLALSDFRGGIGLERMKGAAEVDRAFWSTNQLFFQGHLVLPPLTTRTADSGVSGVFSIGAIGELSDEIYAAFGTSVRKYDNNGDSWGSELHELPAVVTDAITVRLNDVLYLVFTHTNGFSYTSDGSTWVDSIEDAKYPTFWDDKLFLIDNAGQLKYATDLAEVIDESGTVSVVETDGSATLDDTGAIFSATIRDGNHWVRVHDSAGATLTGFIGTADPDTDNTKVNVYSSPARSTQNWVEGGATAFDPALTPITYEVYKVTHDAQLPLPDGSVNELFTYRDAAGTVIIYASTTVGPYAHDFENTKFLETELGLPRHPDNGKGAVKWRGSAFISSGLGIYKYQTGERAVVTVMGPDRDHGLPSDKRGVIRQLIGTHNELLALVNSTASGESLDSFTGDTFTSTVIEPSQGFSMIMGWNELGWGVPWLSGASGTGIDYAIVSNAYDEYRLWWGADQRIYYMRLPRDILNPTQVSDFEYAVSGETITPWFDAGQVEVNKLAVKIIAETLITNGADSVTVSYGTDYSESWTALTAITASGKTEFVLPDSTTPIGEVFRAIRFKVDLQRANSDPDNDKLRTPDLISLTLVYRKKLPSKYVFTVHLDMSKQYKDKTPRQLQDALKTIRESDELQEFTYHDDSSGERTYYVDVVQDNGQDHTGHDERGEDMVTLVEL